MNLKLVGRFTLHLLWLMLKELGNWAIWPFAMGLLLVVFIIVWVGDEYQKWLEKGKSC